MKYIHSKLGREAQVYNAYMNQGNCYRCVELDPNRYYTIEELLPLGFEPVKEEVPEWIDMARKEICSIGPASFVPDTKDWIKQHVCNSVLKHMPKQEQQKVTKRDIEYMVAIRLGGVGGDEVYTPVKAVERLLGSKGLLQE